MQFLNAYLLTQQNALHKTATCIVWHIYLLAGVLHLLASDKCWGFSAESPLGCVLTGGLIEPLLTLCCHVPQLRLLEGGRVECESGPLARERTVPSSAEIGIASPDLNVSVQVSQNNRTLAHPRWLLLWVLWRLV